MRTGANILWFLLGGAVAALAWAVAALLMAISIIGLPWSRGCWEIAAMNLHPFGRDVISVADLRGRPDPLAGAVGFAANLLWLPLGLCLALLHLAHGAVLFCTIIGIPFALQSFKLAAICFAPVGKRVVLQDLADAARVQNASARLAAYRR
jgi:uncharacterized membrane protein YccF (DUF307 family)